MLNLFLILAALTGLPALTEVGRVLMSLLVRLIGLAFAMALVMIVLLALATHGKVILRDGRGAAGPGRAGPASRPVPRSGVCGSRPDL
jgi:hypothetical protein